MAESIMRRFHERYADLTEQKPKIDFVFAEAELDEFGRVKSDPVKCHGRPALAVTRLIRLKDRVMGRGDVEIVIDKKKWDELNRPEQDALLDHELWHIMPTFKTDDIQRPVFRLRQHDVEVGWFNVVAACHDVFSQERKQARALMDNQGQLYWPVIAEVVKQESRTARLELSSQK